MKTLTSALLQRLSFASRAGIRFDGKRDLYTVFGYKRTLRYRDYLDKFHRQDMAKRIISAPVSATWRSPPLIKGSAGLQDTWETLVARHQLWKKIERADKLSGIGNYSVLFLGISGQGKADTPLTKKKGSQLLFAQPYSQPNAEVIELESDVTSPRFGKPLFYRITTSNPLSGTPSSIINILPHGDTTSQFKVHHSRIVHIAEDTLESDIFGTPRLEAVFNILDDLMKVGGGTAEAFWLTANRGMQANISPDTELSDSDMAALSDELDEYQHQLRRWIKTQGVEIKNLGSDVPNPKDTFNMIVALISGATGIPRRILTGSEAGQLASEQDRANWADRINERRFNFAEPCILTPMIMNLSDAGILPEVHEEDLTYKWPSNFQLTPLENAQTMAQKARATINLVKNFSEKNAFISTVEARRILELPDEVDGDIPQGKA